MKKYVEISKDIIRLHENNAMAMLEFTEWSDEMAKKNGGIYKKVNDKLWKIKTKYGVNYA